MSLLQIFKKVQDESPSISDNLFKEDNLDSINIFLDKKLFRKSEENPFEWSASINFKKDSFQGKKQLKVDGKDGFIQLIKEMELFLKTL